MSAMDFSFLEAQAGYYLKEKQKLLVFVYHNIRTNSSGGKFVFIFVFPIQKLLY